MSDRIPYFVQPNGRMWNVIPPLAWYRDKPAESRDIRVDGHRWLWVDGYGWLTPDEARQAA